MVGSSILAYDGGAVTVRGEQVQQVRVGGVAWQQVRMGIGRGRRIKRRREGEQVLLLSIRGVCGRAPVVQPAAIEPSPHRQRGSGAWPRARHRAGVSASSSEAVRVNE